MPTHVPVWSGLVVLLALCSCSGLADGDWPSLRTPTQAASATGTSTAAPVAVGTAPTQALASLAARLDEERRAFDTSAKRWETQSAVFATAASAAGGAPQGSAAWATAQAELTRLNQVASVFADSLDTVNTTAGRLAALQAQGQDVTSVLSDAGRLVLLLEAAITANEQAMTAAQAGLAR